MAKKCKKVCKNCAHTFEPRAPKQSLVKIKKKDIDLGTKVYWTESKDNGDDYKHSGVIKFLTKGTKVWVAKFTYCGLSSQLVAVETSLLLVEA